MRTSGALLQQHIGEMFLKHWKVQRRRVLRQTTPIQLLQQRKIPTIEALDFIKQQPEIQPKKSNPIAGYGRAKAGIIDEDNSRECLVYDDGSLLLEGIDQAKLLTNTVEIQSEPVLPQPLLRHYDPKLEPQKHQLVQKIIKSSVLYDAYQELLPKRKDPERPAWNFAREYGITDRRRNLLLCNRLVSLCQSWSMSEQRDKKVTKDALFEATLTRCGGQHVKLSLRADLLISSKKPIAPFLKPSQTRGLPLPDIQPLLPIVSLEKRQHKLQNVFPINKLPPVRVAKPVMTEEGKTGQVGGGQEVINERNKSEEEEVDEHVHTILVHLNETEVSNIYETEVTESQILGRSLLKCYAAAVAQARQIYGENVLDVEVPVVVQCMQSDGRLFHFCVFQLNTLREPPTTPSHQPQEESSTTRNLFWSLPRMALYDLCHYDHGLPILEGYNPQVFQYLTAFYNNS